MSGAIGFEARGLLEPAYPRFHHPTDVLQDCALSREEKDANLPAWALDAWAPPPVPAPRRPPRLAHPVAIEATLDALNSLDAPPAARPRDAAMRPAGYAGVQSPLRCRRGRPTRRDLERRLFKPPGEITAVMRGA